MHEEIELAYQRIASIIMMDREKINTHYGAKTAAGVADIIRQEIKRAVNGMHLDEIIKYFEI